MVLEDRLIKKVFLLKKRYKTINENKKPLEINYDDSIENITKEIGLAIHQDISQKFIR